MPDTDPDAPQGVPTGYFTQAQIDEAVKAAKQAARQEERDKLYPQQTKRDEQLQTMQTELAELRKAETARQKDAEKAQRDAEKARQAALDADKSAKELLAEREKTWEQKLAEITAAQEAQQAAWAQQREVDQAMMAKEREMASLAIYIRDQIAANQDNIAPELIDLIGGNTQEQVDASVQDMIARTGRIVEGMRQAATTQRAGMPGVAPSGGATALTPGLDTGDQQITAEDIKGMSMQDFAALRQKMGMPAPGYNGRGIFG